MSLPPPPPGPPQNPPPGWGQRPGGATPPPDAPTQVPGAWGAPPPPPAGPPQGSGGWGAPPSGPPTGWGGPASPPPGGGGRRTGLIVGIVALVVLLVGGAVLGGLLVLRSDDEDTTTTTTTSTEATDGSSSEATDGPSGSATDGSTDAGPGGQESDFTPYAPTDDPSDDIKLDVKKADFPGDWNFRLDKKKYDAKALGAWDYSTCADLEAGSALTRKRCQYAVQLTYSAFDGKVRLTQLFMVFDTEPRAKAVGDALVEKDLDLRSGSFFEPRKQGYWVRSSYGNVVVVTVGTSKVKVDDNRLNDITSTMNSDFRGALLFMGM